MVLKAYRLYMADEFLVTRGAGKIGTTYRSTTAHNRSVDEVSNGLYEWYKQAPPRARKGRVSFYRRTKLLYAAYVATCKANGTEPKRCGGVQMRNRRRWLDTWAESRGISFRAPNKKMKLSREEWIKRIGMYWRDSIRVRYHLGDPPFVAWDETPFFADCLEGVGTATTKGDEVVAINKKHDDTRTKYTILLGMTSRNDLPAPKAAIVFTATGKTLPLGRTIRKNLEKETPPPPKRVPFMFTSTGNTQGDMLNEYHQYIEQTIPFITRTTSLSKSKGWFVTTFDSAESHKQWLVQNKDDLLRRKVFPLRVPGGITGDVQTCDRGKNQVFKRYAREDQEEHDLQQARAGVVVPKSTRLDILRRTDMANRAADEEIDAAKIFRQSGATLCLDGSEDTELASSLKVVWEELDMSKWRAEYIRMHQRQRLKPAEVFYSLETVQDQQLEEPEHEDHDESDTEPSDDERDDADDPEDAHDLADDNEAPTERSEPTCLVAPKPLGDTLWSFAEEHKNSPRLRAQLVLYKRRKERELQTAIMPDMVLDPPVVAPVTTEQKAHRDSVPLPKRKKRSVTTTYFMNPNGVVQNPPKPAPATFHPPFQPHTPPFVTHSQQHLPPAAPPSQDASMPPLPPPLPPPSNLQMVQLQQLVRSYYGNLAHSQHGFGL